ncbi:sulfatase family protein [Parabacteroides sp.]
MMNKMLLGGLGLLVPALGMAIPGERPNIILIMADDMGWGDVGFNGNKIIRTPSLDSLASQGLVMERFYSAAPLSSPTRASVLTGRHPFRTGVFSANVGILRKKETTLAEVLKEHGYRTGLFGKWHLGTLTYMETDANRGRVENKHLYNPPVWHGFDESFVTESKVPTYDPMLMPLVNDGCFWDYIHEGDSAVAYGTYYWDKKGVKVLENVSGDDSRLILDRAFPFMDQSVKDKTPFFSVIWFHAPHLPCVAGPEHVALYENMGLQDRNYYGCITALDEQIGRLVSYLKAKGIYENSIICFCSDNGPELETPGSPGHFRGKKRSLYEGGIRVPSLMSWPAKISRGDKLEQPCSTMDYFPTLLDIISVQPDTAGELDGESLWPLISKQATQRIKPMVFCSGNQGAVLDGDYKLYYKKGKYELYDISKDPEEKNDIASLFPEKCEQLKVILEHKVEDYKRSFEDKQLEEGLDWQDWWNIWEQ